MSNQTDRIDRLVGNGVDESGGGLQLPSLLSAILDDLQDNGGKTTIDLVALTSKTLESKRSRVQQIYEVDDPWDNFTQDVLDQLEYKQIIRRDNDVWQLGEKFVLGKPMQVIRRKGGADITVTVYSAEEREARGRDEVARMEATSLAAELHEDRPGLRSLDQKHVNALAERMRTLGYLEHHPILIDQHGRILDGRHRLAAAKLADVVANRQVVKVSSDGEALEWAWLANENRPGNRPWSAHDRKKWTRKLQVAGVMNEAGNVVSKRAVRRAMIEAELRADAGRSDGVIAEKIGCSHVTVRSIRSHLVATCQIDKLSHTVGKDGVERPVRKPRRSSSKAESVRQRILTWIDDRGRATVEELADGLDIEPKFVSARLSELKGVVVRDDEGYCVMAGRSPEPSEVPQQSENNGRDELVASFVAWFESTPAAKLVELLKKDRPDVVALLLAGEAPTIQ
jgi:ParB-like nuclease domain